MESFEASVAGFGDDATGPATEALREELEAVAEREAERNEERVVQGQVRAGICIFVMAAVSPLVHVLAASKMVAIPAAAGMGFIYFQVNHQQEGGNICQVARRTAQDLRGCTVGCFHGFQDIFVGLRNCGRTGRRSRRLRQ